MNIYTYVDPTGLLREITQAQLNFVGPWEPTVPYNQFDVVSHNLTRYICTSSNSGQEPDPHVQFNQFWSVLAFTSTGSSSGTISSGVTSINGVNGAVLLAAGSNITIVQNGQTFTFSSTGTSGGGGGGSVPAWVMQWLGQTYNIARAGTDAAHSADSWGRDAFSLAVTGTDAAAAAQATADEALGLALEISGTNVPAWVMQWLAQTYNLGVAGTNAANSADKWGRDAYSLAVSGTNAAAAAQQTADEALGLALELAGTNVPAWVMQWLAQTYNIARSGTDAANAVAVTAGEALSTAWVGTNAANQADQKAGIALSTAWAGTDAAHSADSWGRDAFSIAVAGTNLAQTAYNLAVTAAGTGGVPPWVMQWIGGIQTIATHGTDAANIAFTLAGEAFTLAGVGTNAAAAAESLAGTALSVASAGTNAANIAFTYAGEAFTLAGVGTNAAAAAEALAGHALSVASAGTDAAHSADSWGRDAFSLATVGTNAANIAYQLAGEAYTLAIAGTNAAAAATVPAWVMSWIGGINTVANAGTDAAHSADSWARDAFGLAVVGTNAAAAAQASANQAESDAQLALSEIATLSTLVLVGQTGTNTYFLGQVPGWKTDIQVTIQNGVVTSTTNSRYSIETFLPYNVGPIGTIAGDLGLMSNWNGSGRALSWSGPYPNDYLRETRIGFRGGMTNDMLCNGTWGVDLTALNSGTGWGSQDPWLVIEEGFRVMGTEGFESFSTGVVYGTNFTAAIGYGWTGTVGFY